MTEDKKSLINLVPDSVDNAIKNITDKSTQYIGTTFADIWYLIFGGISQAAEKRKLKYSYALQEFKKELQEKISKIPEDKLDEPDIQIVAPALEASKYCLEKENLRNMFSTLISSSMNTDFSNLVHPTYIDILKHLSDFDAQLLLMIYQNDAISFTNLIENNINDLQNLQRFVKYLSLSFYNLENLGLICNFNKDKYDKDYYNRNRINNYFDYHYLFRMIIHVFYFNKKHVCDKINNIKAEICNSYDYFIPIKKVRSIEKNLFFVNTTLRGEIFMSCCFDNQ